MRPTPDLNSTATLEAIRNRHPVYAELLDTFGPLFEQREALAESFSRREILVPDPDSELLAQGIPLLGNVSLEGYGKQLEEAAQTVAPLFAKILDNGNAFPEISELNLPVLCRAYLDGDITTLDRAARDISMHPALLSFFLWAVAGPVLRDIASRTTESLTDKAWKEGTCPVCGSLPSLAVLSRREQTDLDQLVGGGGRKYLHCSLCGHDWHYRRDACAACGNHDSNKREIRHAEEFPHERIETCSECNSYLLCIDLREESKIPALDVAPLGLVHLDLIAHGDNLAPLNQFPWNTPTAT